MDERTELKFCLGVARVELGNHMNRYRRVYDEGARLQEEVDRLAKAVKELPLEKSSKKRKG